MDKPQDGCIEYAQLKFGSLVQLSENNFDTSYTGYVVQCRHEDDVKVIFRTNNGLLYHLINPQIKTISFDEEKAWLRTASLCPEDETERSYTIDGVQREGFHVGLHH